MTNMDELLERLNDLFPEIDFTRETRLMDGGLLTSLDLVMLVTELNDAYEIEITSEELLSENFNSAEAIWALIRRMQEA